MEQIIFQTPWISVKRTPRGFDYLERKGKDSVAVLLIRDHRELGIQALIRYQPLCVHNADIDDEQRLYPCLITGGMEAGEDSIECAIREVKEEAGYDLPLLALKPLKSYIVGTQTNEVCHLFFADVTGFECGVASQDGTYFESISRNEWKSIDFLLECDYVACQLGYLWLVRRMGWIDS